MGISSFKEDLDDALILETKPALPEELTFKLRLWNEDEGTLLFKEVLAFKEPTNEQLDYIYEEQSGNFLSASLAEKNLQPDSGYSLFRLENNEAGIFCEVVAKGVEFSRQAA